MGVYDMFGSSEPYYEIPGYKRPIDLQANAKAQKVKKLSLSESKIKKCLSAGITEVYEIMATAKISYSTVKRYASRKNYLIFDKHLISCNFKDFDGKFYVVNLDLPAFDYITDGIIEYAVSKNDAFRFKKIVLSGMKKSLSINCALVKKGG